jgi:hypothetical protein
MTRCNGSGFFLLGVCLVIAIPAQAMACPCCEGPPGPIREHAGRDLIVYGQLVNSILPGSNKDDVIEQTSLFVSRVIKGRHLLKGEKVIILDEHVSFENPKHPPKAIIFFDVSNGRCYPRRGIVVRSEKAIDYVRGIRALDPKDNIKAVRYFFRYLDNADPEVAADALREFTTAEYKDIRKVAPKIPANKIAQWLKNPKSPMRRRELSALLLGHCGREKHARLLRRILDNPKCRRVRYDYNFHEFLVGYTLLKPREGWRYVRAIIGNHKEEWIVRYGALRSIRFLWDNRADVVTKKELLKGMCLLLDRTDVADFAIEDLRARKCWDVADKVLALAKKESHNLPVIRRALLRYALSCPPKQAKAVAFVKAERKKDKGYVADVEEALKLETEAFSEEITEPRP